MLPAPTSIGNDAIALARLSPGERWLLAAVAIGCALLLVMMRAGLRHADQSDILLPPPAPAAATAPRFDVAAELALLETAEAEVVDLAATADVGERDRFAAAAGPPLNLLAQLGPQRAKPQVLLAAAKPALAGPKLTEEEQLVVDANAERREVLVALSDLSARAEARGPALALAVRPLLARAEAAAKDLDAFGDALLLSDGAADRQLAYFGFQASRAAALGEIERATAMLG